MTIDLGTTSLCARNSQENQLWLVVPRTSVPMRIKDTNEESFRIKEKSIFAVTFELHYKINTNPVSGVCKRGGWVAGWTTSPRMRAWTARRSMVSAITLMIIMTQATKTDKFSGNIRRGWGVIFNPKVYVANFGPLYRLFRTFSAREIAYNFLKIRVGDQRTFEIFLKIHPFWY